MSNLAVDLNQTHEFLSELFYAGDKPFLDTFEQIALDYFSSFEMDELKPIIKEVKESDVVETLTALSSEVIRHKQVNTFRIFPSSMQEEFFKTRRSGKGRAIDMQYKTKTNQRYVIGFHSKGEKSI